MSPDDLPELVLEDAYDDIAALYRDADRNLELLLSAHEAEGLQLSCRKGCDACCHQLVLSTVAEARVAADAIRPLLGDPAWKARIEAWLAATQEIRADLQLGARQDPDRLEDLVEDLAGRYWTARIACPFLVDHTCGIYAERPLACRHHLAVSDPVCCASADGEGIQRPAGADEAFFFAQEAIAEEDAEIGIFPELVALEFAD